MQAVEPELPAPIEDRAAWMVLKDPPEPADIQPAGGEVRAALFSRYSTSESSEVGRALTKELKAAMLAAKAERESLMMLNSNK